MVYQVCVWWQFVMKQVTYSLCMRFKPFFMAVIWNLYSESVDQTAAVVQDVCQGKRFNTKLYLFPVSFRLELSSFNHFDSVVTRYWVLREGLNWKLVRSRAQASRKYGNAAVRFIPNWSRLCTGNSLWLRAVRTSQVRRRGMLLCIDW